MFNSVRWSVLGWHALILVLVLTVFGATLFYGLSYAALREIDAELKGDAQVLIAALRKARPPKVQKKKYADQIEQYRDNGEMPSVREGVLSIGKGRPRTDIEPRFEIPDSFLRRFGNGDTHYFVVWNKDREVLETSNAEELDVPFPENHLPVHQSPEQWRIRERGEMREIVVAGPSSTRLIVGRSMQKERANQGKLLGLLVITGFVVLAIGLTGGWSLSRRALLPIEKMSATAEAISASNLSQRIDVAGTKSELGKLARVLNSAFARLEAAFERQTRFTADASHELRTPLAILRSHTELALAKNRLPEEYREALEVCSRASKRMETLVNDLLTLARSDEDELVLKRQQFDLQATVENSVALLRPLAAERRVQLNLDLQPVEFVGDSDRIAQVVTNLLTNAIDYNCEDGSVTVHLAVVDGEVVLDVSDTGMGIPEEERAFIFERFYRINKARSGGLGGSGLGLAICRCIIEAHGGQMTLTSEINKGTTFVARLPICRTSPAAVG